MDCKDRARQITDLLAGELDAAAKAELTAHMESCPSCKAEFDELNAVWCVAENGFKTTQADEALSPANYANIFAAKKASRRGVGMFRWITSDRVVFYLVACFIVVLFAGMFLPSLRTSARATSSFGSNNASDHVELLCAEVSKNTDKDGMDISSRELDELAKDEGFSAFGGYSPVNSHESRGKAKQYCGRASKDKSGVIPAKGSLECAAGSAPAPTLQPPAEDAPLLECAAGSAPAPTKPSSSRASEPSRQDDAPLDEIAEPVPAPENAPASMVAGESSGKVADMEAPALRQELKKAGKREEIGDSNAPMHQGMHMAGTEVAIDRKSDAKRQIVSSLFAKELEQGVKTAEMPKEIDTSIMSNVGGEDIPAWKANEKLVRLKVSDYRLNLKLWDMTTPDDASSFLKRKGVQVDSGMITVDKESGRLTVKASPGQIEMINGIVEELNDREEKLNSTKDGLPMNDTKMKPVSTFSIDVDTASYTLTRKLLQEGRRPSPEMVRPEEFINYFDYHYRSPEGAVFSVHLEAAPSPFRPGNFDLMVGVQSKTLGPEAKKPSSFTVFVDTSGSMSKKSRMELVQKCLMMMLEQMKSGDTLSILECGPEPKILIDGVPPEVRPVISRAIARLKPGGATDLGRGIAEAYRLALKNYRPGAFNRVIAFTDGIGGLGTRDPGEILKRIDDARQRGITNTIVELGGDGQEDLLEALADKGDGQYIFLDSEEEAESVFKDSFEAKFREVARDVKIQVEFNQDSVLRYRQVGYQNRQLAKADFRNDKVDAGEVGAGQGVTALYEMQLAQRRDTREFRQEAIASVRLRYNLPDTMEVQEREFMIQGSELKPSTDAASDRFLLACSVAEFAERLRYPDCPGIANAWSIENVLRRLLSRTYSADPRVKELIPMILSTK